MRSNNLPLVAGFVAVLLLVAAVNSPGKPKSQPTAQPVAVPAEPEATVLYDYWSPTCGPCMQMKSTVAKLEASGQKIARRNVDVDSREYMQGTSIPQFVAVRRGEVVGRITGATSLESLKALCAQRAVEKVVDSDAPAAPIADQTNPLTNSPDGWRLRLFYPRGDKAGEQLKTIFESRLPAIATKYGFAAFTTDDEHFAYWRKAGYPGDRLTLVLVKVDGKVAYYKHEVTKDVDELRAAIRDAAKRTWEK